MICISLTLSLHPGGDKRSNVKGNTVGLNSVFILLKKELTKASVFYHLSTAGREEYMELYRSKGL